jgi:diguanylate cyclase (GGDEF)-like protein
MMQENRLFEALLDVIPFAAYAVDVETYEVVYANRMMSEKMYAPREEFCWQKLFGQEEVCSWCTIPKLKQRERQYKSDKLISNFFDEGTDVWFQAYDELISWPDGRTVKYSIAVDITEQKEIQASMIKTHAKLAMQSKKLKEANEKLEFMAKKDFLTGINNRGQLFKLGQILLDKENTENSIFVAMLDLDKFKSLNDKYGHMMGDLALKMFAEEVNKHLSKNDIFGRLGGEEFALILSSNDENTIVEKINNIQKSIEKIVMKSDENQISFTVSIGLVKHQTGETLDIVLDRADKELYGAKDEGRNRLKFRF